jgi:cation diffusion facilitator family transporter
MAAAGAFTPPEVEQRGLLISIVITAVLGVLGIIWGIVSGSQMILLDGVYSFIGVVITGMLLRAAKLADAGPTRRYPFGLEAATPLVIGIQGCVLLATLLYALLEAVFTIVDGGSDVTAGVALVYAAVNTVVSIASWVWLRRIPGTSDLLAAETVGWRVSSFRGIGMIVGFVGMAMLADSRWEAATPYVDPVMVMVTCLAFVATPVQMVRSTLVELLEGAPEPEVEAPVRDAVTRFLASAGVTEHVVLMSKVGPKLYVEVDGIVSSDVTVGVEHDLRARLETELDALPYEIWLNFELRPRIEPRGEN